MKRYINTTSSKVSFKHIKVYKSVSSNLKLYSFRKHSFNLFLNIFRSISANTLAQLLHIFKYYYALGMSRVYFGSISVPLLYMNLPHTNYNVGLFTNYFSNVGDVVDSLGTPSSLTVPTVLLHSFSTGVETLEIFIKNLNLLVTFITYCIQFSYPSLGTLPNSNKTFTILRSPHTDKKSREQFNLVYHTKVMSDVFNLYKPMEYMYKHLFDKTFFIQYKNNKLY